MRLATLRGLPPGSPPAASTPDANPSLAPHILFAASPGTITGVITLSVAHVKSGIPVTALVAVAVATTVMWISIVLVARFDGSGGFVHSAVTRFMGLIVIAMGVQFALSGMRSFMLETDHAAHDTMPTRPGVTRNVWRTPRGCDNPAGVGFEEKSSTASLGLN